MTKVFFAVVSIAALCCVAFAQTVREQCEPEIQQLQDIAAKFDEYSMEDDLPECIKPICEEVRGYGWKGIEEIMESMKKMNDKFEEPETQECIQKFIDKFNEVAEAKMEDMKEAIDNFGISDACRDSGRDAVFAFMEEMGFSPPK